MSRFVRRIVRARAMGLTFVSLCLERAPSLARQAAHRAMALTFVSLCLVSLAGSPADASAESLRSDLPAVTGPSPEGIYHATLDNGLDVLMKEVRTAPLMCVSIWYRAGTKHEEAGTIGLAHLLEHMMFKGTAAYGKGVFDETLEANGAVNNATTWLDRTNYFILIAKERADLALELEADRMRGALFTQQDLEDEMPVVRNEMEVGEDDPWVELDERMGSVAILEHPYHRPTIGWKSDVEAITAEQIHQFYDRHYWPDNAYLVLVGDLSVEEMLAKAVHHFGEIPAGADPKQVVTVEPPQKGERRFLIRETGQNRLLGMAYRVPQRAHADTPALDLLGRVLAGGKTGRLYRALVEEGLATDVYAYNQGEMADPFLFYIYATLEASASPDSVENRIYEVVEGIKSAPPAADELARAIKQTRVDEFFARDELTSLMFKIGEAESAGGYELHDAYLPSIESVAPEDLQRVAQTYLGANSRTVGFYLPNGEDGGSWSARPGDPHPSTARDVGERIDGCGEHGIDVARRDSKRESRAAHVASHAAPPGSYAALTPSRGPAPALSLRGARAQRPVTTGGVATAALPERSELPNGVVLLVRESRENPTVALRARIEGGLLVEPEGKWGVAELTASALTLGTREHSATELAELLESNGIDISAWSTADAVELRARCLSEDLPLLLELLGEIVVEPAFVPEQVEIARSQVTSALREKLQSTYSVAYQRAMSEIYGEGSAYARLTEGTRETIAGLTPDDLREYHRQLLHGRRWTVAIVGDVAAEEARELLAASLSDIPAGEEVQVEPPQIQDEALDGGVHQIPVADKSQVDLVFVGRGVPPWDEQYDAAHLANVVLGGSFTSRLNGALRDDEGLTYGAGSFFIHRAGDTHWVATLGVNPDNVEQALASVRRELETLHQDSITEEEFAKARAYAAGSYPMELQSKSSVARELLYAEKHDLGADYIPTYSERVRGIERDAVERARLRIGDPDRIVVVVAGTFAEDGAAPAADPAGGE